MMYISMIGYLDSVRHQKNLTVEKMCDGITNPKQYYKFINGLSDPSINKFEMFVTLKLEMKMSEFFILYEDHLENIVSKLVTG
ncbi:hypothetical protein LJC17_02635 [Acholeplasma sp. OttesenSCG-928-E16]|nr:hypothetical protein [Acholeplasma sp. OttesenSCG-928-E16]